LWDANSRAGESGVFALLVRWLSRKKTSLCFAEAESEAVISARSVELGLKMN